MRINGDQEKIAEGTALKMLELIDKSIFAVWEKENKILVKTL